MATDTGKRQATDGWGFLRSSLWSFGGNATGRAAVLLTIAVAIAELEPEAFGRYVGLQAAALFAALAWDAGSSPLLTRAIAAGTHQRASALRRIVGWRLHSLPVPAIALVVGVLIVYQGEVPRFGIWLALASYVVLQNTQQVLLAVLGGKLDFRAAAVASAWGRIATLLLSIAAVKLVPGNAVEALVWALAGGEAVSAVAAAWLLRRRHPQDVATGSDLRFRAGLPFALSGVMVVAYNRLDVIVVAALASSGVVGTYAPASRLQDALYIAPFAVSAVLFPLLARMGAGEVDRRKLVRTFWRGTAASVAVSVAVAVAAFLLLGPIIRGVAPDYVASIEPCRIIVWSLPIVALNACLVSLLNAAGRADLVPYGIGIALISSMVLNVILVPMAEANGAAIAAGLREVPAALVLLTVAVRSGALRRHDLASV